MGNGVSAAKPAICSVHWPPWLRGRLRRPAWPWATVVADPCVRHEGCLVCARLLRRRRTHGSGQSCDEEDSSALCLGVDDPPGWSEGTCVRRRRARASGHQGWARRGKRRRGAAQRCRSWSKYGV